MKQKIENFAGEYRASLYEQAAKMAGNFFMETAITSLEALVYAASIGSIKLDADKLREYKFSYK